MRVNLYFDVQVRRAVAEGLRLRGVNVLTAQEDGAARWNDPDLVDRAMFLGRVLFTHDDDDFLKEAARRQQDNIDFSGIIYAHQLNITIHQCIADLELISQASSLEEFKNQIVYLPLR